MCVEIKRGHTLALMTAIIPVKNFRKQLDGCTNFPGIFSGVDSPAAAFAL